MIQTISAAFLALALLAPAAWAQPAPAPTAEDIEAAYANSLRYEREQALRRVEGAFAAGPEAAGVRAAEAEVRFTVTLHGCAPAAAGEVGHVCHYDYRVDDGRVGASYRGPDLVRGHVFPGPDGLLVRELPPPPGPFGPRTDLGAASEDE